MYNIMYYIYEHGPSYPTEDTHEQVSKDMISKSARIRISKAARI